MPLPWSSLSLFLAGPTGYLTRPTTAQFSGIFNNCSCKAGFAGYVGFGDATFYRQHYDVERFWIAGAVVGIVFSFVVTFICFILWSWLKPLWKANELASPVPPTEGIELGDLGIASSLVWSTV
jgi:hypothetical protein